MSTIPNGGRWWATQLEASAGPFFCGARPTGVDVVLFGQIQCMSTAVGHTGHALRLLADEPALLAWVRRMNACLGDDFLWLSSATLEQRDPRKWRGPTCCPLEQRVAFYIGIATFATVLLPLTLCAFVFHNIVK